MARLEPHDELGLPWDVLADGRVHRLVKGRDFGRGADLVEQAAANAAGRLSLVVRKYREIRFGIVYLWVQFVDHEVVIGEPCPCGGQLLQVNQNFAECSSCNATVALLKPKRESEEEEMITEDEPLLVGLLAARPAAQRNGRRTRAGIAAPPLDPRRDLTRLGAYSQITLYGHLSDERRVRLYGHGLGLAGETCLMVVDYPLENGSPVEDPSFPGRRRHAVWSMPAGPFGSLVRLEELDGREPVLRIDDPLRDWSPAPSPAPAPDAGQPPATLASLVDVTLFPRSGGRFCGHARTADGETVILTVRSKGPLDEGSDTVGVRCVPVAPFGSAVDTQALFAKEPGSPMVEREPPAEPPPPPEGAEQRPRQVNERRRRRMNRTQAETVESTNGDTTEAPAAPGAGTKRERRGRRRRGEADETVERPSA